GMCTLPRRRQAALALDAVRQQAAIERPYDIAAMMIILTVLVVGAFYCLEALHGERRGRRIPFLESPPGSARTPLASKASIPLLFLPLLSFALILSLQLILFLLSSAVLAGNGMSTKEQFVPAPLGLLSLLVVTALWHAPVYGWLLLVSAWAKRAVFL